MESFEEMTHRETDPKSSNKLHRKQLIRPIIYMIKTCIIKRNTTTAYLSRRTTRREREREPQRDRDSDKERRRR